MTSHLGVSDSVLYLTIIIFEYQQINDHLLVTLTIGVFQNHNPSNLDSSDQQIRL